MTLHLILTRHAKSAWTDPTLDDFDRPLNGRGRRSCAAVGDWLAAREVLPGDVIVSGARRTVETWSRISQRLSDPPDMQTDQALYHASAPMIMKVLRAATAPVTMLIGHNPGIGEFAERIVSRQPQHPRYGDYPTCATAIIAFKTSAWRDIDWGDGRLLAFTVPRDLME